MTISMIAFMSILINFLPSSGEGSEFSEKDIKRFALEAILENPKIVMDAVDLLRVEGEAQKAKSIGAVILDNSDAIIDDENAPVLGNPNGDVTIVEFFDYNCPYCKRAAMALHNIIDQDKNIRVVMREWPVLNKGSVFGARAALAARIQGKYEEFHWALMKLSRVDEARVLKLAAEIGLDVDKLKKDMESKEVSEHLEISNNLANVLEFSGTPSFIIGSEAIPGFVPQEKLEELIAKARDAKKL